MRKNISILIADRNRNIREFLRRELGAEGYRVQLANDGREVLMMIELESPDILILDLEIPNVDGFEILRHLRSTKNNLPVVVHTFLTDYASHPLLRYAAAFVEKKGNNIEGLKAAIRDVVREHYPYRVTSVDEGRDQQYR
ncbi:MAG: response regulator [Deltaproteobacteria bacterium]|nr:response regulator [Deltaproteobacteria bacterium]